LDNKAKQPAPKAACDQFSTCIESFLKSAKDLNLAKNIKQLKTSLSYLELTSSIKSSSSAIYPSPSLQDWGCIEVGQSVVAL